MKRLFYFLSILLLISCGNSGNTEEFISTTTGRYLFNTNETIEVSFDDSVMTVKWRGQTMQPVKVNDSSFYLKEMNEKLVFYTKPNLRIELASKREHEGEKFVFVKLGENEKTPSEHFADKEYDKALQGYLEIQKKDSLDRNISEWRINDLGYRFLREKKYDEAEAMFKINVALYPKSSNTYDSMGDVYRAKKDTVRAIEFYKKALEINPERRGSKNRIDQLTKN